MFNSHSWHFCIWSIEISILFMRTCWPLYRNDIIITIAMFIEFTAFLGCTDSWGRRGQPVLEMWWQLSRILSTLLEVRNGSNVYKLLLLHSVLECTIVLKKLFYYNFDNCWKIDLQRGMIIPIRASKQSIGICNMEFDNAWDMLCNVTDKAACVL